MKRILYIISLLILTVSCISESLDGQTDTNLSGKSKVMVDFCVQVNDPAVVTKSLADKPILRNLMVAVFDESGYLLEYTYATEIDLATENTTKYSYKVAITQSSAPRILHFIGNAPDKLKFGVEGTVLAEITSTCGQNADDGIYWCRREVPGISGTNSGGMLLDDDDPMAVNTPIYQADTQTRAYFDNVGLIRNFSQIQLVATSSAFTLEKYFVVGTPKTGLASAYNYQTGRFVDYFTVSSVTGNDTDGYSFTLGAPKTYAEIIAEGYDANVLPNAERFTLAESSNESAWIAAGASAYVYECEKPLKAEDAVYIIAYGTYSDGNKYYYKIDLRNANGYFPILRNFKYTIDITEVTRVGYDTIEKAASSAGSGDISTSLETKSLAYISDGVASLEVEYIEKYMVTEDNVTLSYKFIDNVSISHLGNYNKMWFVVNEPGATGAAISKINGNDYTVGQTMTVSANPGTITITPTALTDAPKSQTITLFAEYVNGDVSHVLQRTVNYIVQSKRKMVVSLSPSEVPNVAGSGFDVNISLPAGLSKSIFPLEFLVESGSLTINPYNDQMPVRTGTSLVDSGKSSFYFVKTLQYSDYDPTSGAINKVACHFKTIKNEGATHIYAANSYFITEYDYEGTVSSADSDGRSVYLDTYSPHNFSNLSFSSVSIGVGEYIDVKFTFQMEKIPDDGVVYVALGNLQPAPTETRLTYMGLENGKVVYSFRPTGLSATFDLQTAHFDADVSVDLSAYHFIPTSKTASRSLYTFSGSFNKSSLTGVAETVKYTFYLPYNYEGMVVEVEMKGLGFNEGRLPADWDNWRYMGNDIYAVEYEPSNLLNSVTIDLVTTIASSNEPCTITLNSPGYETQTSSIYVTQELTIPKGKLIMSLPSNSSITYRDGTGSSTDRRIYIYKEDGTQLGYYTYTSDNNSRRATNNSDITLSPVSYDTLIYVTYTRNNTTYKSSTFTIDTAMTNGVTQTLSR